MNGPHTPAFSRDNRFTRLIERVAQQNAADGKPAGRMLEQMANTTPLIPAHRVRRMSTEEARRTDYVPPPEDPRVAMMSNARAAALGLSTDMIPTMDDDLPGDIGSIGNEPTDADIDMMLAQARGQALPGVQTAAEGAAAPAPPMTAREAAAAQRVALPRGNAAPVVGLAGPRSMPNFANVEGFDLARKVAVVDGMEFKLADDDVVAMKKFAIQVVLDNVTYQLAQALVQLGIPQEMAQATAEKMRETAASAAPGGTTNAGVAAAPAEAVQHVQKGPGAEPVLQGPTSEGRTHASLPDLRGDLQYLLEPEVSEPEVPANSQGSRNESAQPSIGYSAADDAGSLLGDGGIGPS